ncbi:HlyD family secretion protein [Luteimonas suaedae]|uniref:HlyD family secretion protein n=1 Tax=Luteimonas suaedae TaxID=2605430 RepID=UPI0011ECF4DF|nr:HlyD family efflux transporter periplasmic adaptor subunit [Luteimonas suaedae]
MVEGLFRDEVLEARRQDWLGSVHLSTSRLAWPMAAIAALAVITLVLILAFGSYTRKERVHGRLVPVGGLQMVAAPAAGVLTRLLVGEGQAVAAGQPLLEISPDLDTAQPGGAVGEQVAMGLERQRERLHRDLAELVALQAQREAALHARVRSLQRQLASAAAELEVRTRQAAGARRTLERIRPLQGERIVSDVQIQQYEELALNAEAQRELAERNRLDLDRQLTDARQKLEALPLRSGERRSTIERTLAEVAQSAARNQAQRSVLVRAPGPGIVSGLAVDAGQAVSERQRLLSIEPEDAELRAELWVPSRAIGTLAPGGRVAMRYHAFPYQTFGQQYGRIVEVAGSALGPDEVRARTGIDPGVPVYRVLVAPDRQHVSAGNRTLALRASMGLDADLLLERRRLYRLILAAFDGPRSDPPPGAP